MTSGCEEIDVSSGYSIDKHFTLRGLPRPSLFFQKASWIGDWYVLTASVDTGLASQHLAKSDCRFRTKLMSAKGLDESKVVHGHCSEIRLTFPRHFETLSLARPTFSFNVPGFEHCDSSVKVCSSVDGGR